MKMTKSRRARLALNGAQAQQWFHFQQACDAANGTTLLGIALTCYDACTVRRNSYTVLDEELALQWFTLFLASYPSFEELVRTEANKREVESLARRMVKQKKT